MNGWPGPARTVTPLCSALLQVGVCLREGLPDLEWPHQQCVSEAQRPGRDPPPGLWSPGLGCGRLRLPSAGQLGWVHFHPPPRGPVELLVSLYLSFPVGLSLTSHRGMVGCGGLWGSSGLQESAGGLRAVFPLPHFQGDSSFVVMTNFIVTPQQAQEYCAEVRSCLSQTHKGGLPGSSVPLCPASDACGVPWWNTKHRFTQNDCPQ